jgi:hypothetical protein
MAPASFSWSDGMEPQSAAPPLLLPELLPLLLLPELLPELLPPLLLPELLPELLPPSAWLPELLPPPPLPLLLLLQAAAPMPPVATVSADPRTKVRVRMFIASTPFVRNRPRVSPDVGGSYQVPPGNGCDFFRSIFPVRLD